jgi:hypothetical protein
VIGNQSAHCCLMLHYWHFEIIGKFALLTLGNLQGHSYFVGCTAICAENAGIRRNKYILVELYQNFIDVRSAQLIIDCALNVHSFAFICHVFCVK